MTKMPIGKFIRFSGVVLPDKRKTRGESDSKGYRFLRYSISKQRNCFYEQWIRESVFLDKIKNTRSKRKLGGILVSTELKKVSEGKLKYGDLDKDGMRFHRYNNQKGKIYEVWYPEPGFKLLHQSSLKRFQQSYKANPEKHRIRLEKQRKANPLKFKEYSKRYYNKNRSSLLQQAAEDRKGLPWSYWLLKKAFRRGKGKLDIDTDYLETLLKEQDGRCFWTGVVMSLEGCGSSQKLYEISIDRINNSKGYRIGNCTLTSRGINLGRSATNSELWKVFLRELGVQKWQSIEEERPHKRVYPYWASRLMSSATSSSKLRRHPSPLFNKALLSDILAKQDQRCFWSGIKMDLTGPYDPFNPFKVSIDRLDNTLPYSPDNIALVCMAMNKARNMDSMDDFKKYLDDIRGVNSKPFKG